MSDLKEQKISEKILKLKQEINSIGHNCPLDHVNIGFIEKMELDLQSGHSVYSNYLEQIKIVTNKCLNDYEDYQSFISLKNIYAEAFIYSLLNAVLFIEKIPETETKSPDFKITHKGEPVFVEVKSINMVGGTLKHRGIMEEGFESKVRLEKEIQQKKSQPCNGKNIVASDVTTIKPYEKHGNDYDSSSPKLVIESLIDKISQNLKKDQFSYGDTLLLINFSDQLLLSETPQESIRENYIAEYRDNSENFNYLIEHELSIEEQKGYWSSIESCLKQKIYFYNAKGCLWHIAFGQIGTILREDGEGNEPELLDKQGILHEYDFVDSILFYIDGKFYACLRDARQTSFFHLCSYLEQINFIEGKSIYTTT